MIARVRLALLVATLTFVGCARIESPTGGPLDDRSPRLARSFPDSGAVNVGPIDSLAFVFDERMDKASVERGFVLSPPAQISSRRWVDDRWELLLETPLSPDVTYVAALSATITDRRKNDFGRTVFVVFATGERLDDGRLRGSVLGQRYPGKGAWVFLWPYESAAPDTSEEGAPPDPLRFTQADEQGIFQFEAVPRGRPLRLCSLYDRDQDRIFDPIDDRYGCVDEPIVLGASVDSTAIGAVPADTSGAAIDFELVIADADEPGTVKVAVIDSLCRGAEPPLWVRLRAERDSLVEVTRGQRDAFGPTGAARAGLFEQLAREEATTDSIGAGPTPEAGAAPSAADSLAWGVRLVELDERIASTRGDSVECAAPIVCELVQPSGEWTTRPDAPFAAEEIVRTGQGYEVAWSDVPPGIYRLRAFRDRDGDGHPGPSEPFGVFPTAIEVRPIRTVDGIRLQLAARDSPP